MLQEIFHVKSDTPVEYCADKAAWVTEIGRSGVYCIKNVVNGKKYIGSAVDLKDRWRVHYRELCQNRHHSQYLQRAWNKYGMECFRFIVLERVENLEDLLIREQWWMDSNAPAYNVCKLAVSRQGLKNKPESLARLKITRSIPEVKARIGEALSLALRGRKFSPEHRENLSKAGRGRRLRPLTEEEKESQRQKMLAHLKGETDEQRETHYMNIRLALAREDVKRKMSEKSYRRWAEMKDEDRKRHIASLYEASKKGHASVSGRAREHDAEVIRLKTDGCSPADIALRLGISRRKINEIINRHFGKGSVLQDSQIRSEALSQEIRRLRSAGLTQRAIMDKLRCSLDRVKAAERGHWRPHRKNSE